METWYQIHTQEKTELKTLHQLKMLGVKTFVPTCSIEMSGIKQHQLKEEQILYASISDNQLESVLHLPFVTDAAPCSTPPSVPPSWEW